MVISEMDTNSVAFAINNRSSAIGVAFTGSLLFLDGFPPNRDLQIKVKPQFSEFTNNSQDKKWHDKKAASNLKKEAA